MKTTMMWVRVAIAAMTLVGCGEKAAPSAPPAPVTQASAAPTPVAVAAPVATPPACPVVAAAPAPAVAAKPAVVKDASAQLVVKRLVVATGVKGHEPVDAGTSFKVGGGRKIFAFVELDNKAAAPGEITVAFEPPDGGASRGNVKLAVGGEPHWRTWAFTRTAREPGAWTAVVRDHHGAELARAPFEIL